MWIYIFDDKKTLNNYEFEIVNKIGIKFELIKITGVFNDND